MLVLTRFLEETIIFSCDQHHSIMDQSPKKSESIPPGRGRGRGQRRQNLKRNNDCEPSGHLLRGAKKKKSPPVTSPTNSVTSTPPQVGTNVNDAEKVVTCGKSIDISTETFMNASQLGCMLLHSNISKQPLNIYNPFYNISVNVRKFLDITRLSVSSKNKEDPMNKDNMLIRLCQSEGSGRMDSPLQNRFVYAVASFSEDGKHSGLLYPTYLVPNQCQEKSYYAVPLSTDLISSALNWLCKSEDVVVVQDVTVGLNLFFERLRKMQLPNTDAKYLKEFIIDREWTGRLWGESKEIFLDTLQKTDVEEHWILLRRFVNFNMAWQTKMLFFSVDCLHRTALSDTVFNGIAPPGANDEIKEMATAFAKALVPGSVQENSMAIVSCYIPQTIDDNFCLRMQNDSASKQKDNARQANHTVIHTLQSIVNSMNLTVGYLLDGVGPIYEMKGATTCHEEKFEQFRTMLKADFKLTEIPIATIIREVEEELEKKSKKTKASIKTIKTTTYNCSTIINTLAEIYIGTWLHIFSGQLHSHLQRFSQTFEDIANIDPDIHIKLLSEMNVIDFQKMFKTHQNRKYNNFQKMASYKVNPCSFTNKTEPILGALFGQNKFTDVLIDDIYKKPWKIRESFPSALLELVWIILYTKLSKQSEKAIQAFLTPMVGPGTYPQQLDNNCLQSKARRMIRCLHLTIHQSFTSSRNMWNIGFFDRDEGKKSNPSFPLTMYQPSQDFFLFISAIHHSCQFFAQMGHSPKSQQSYTDFKHELVQQYALDLESFSTDGTTTFENTLMQLVTDRPCTPAMTNIFRCLEDEITRNTVNFMMKTRLNEMVCEKEGMHKNVVANGKKWLAMLSESVRRDVRTEVIFTSNHSIVGLAKDTDENMTMEHNHRDELESIIQVFGCERGKEQLYECCSHRIGDAPTSKFNWTVFLEIWQRVKALEVTPIGVGGTSKGVITVGEELMNNNEGSAGGTHVSSNTGNSPQEGTNLMEKDSSEGIMEEKDAGEGTSRKNVVHTHSEGALEKEDGGEEMSSKIVAPNNSEGASEEKEATSQSDGKQENVVKVRNTLLPTYNRSNILTHITGEVFGHLGQVITELKEKTDFKGKDEVDQISMLNERILKNNKEGAVIWSLCKLYVKESNMLEEKSEKYSKKLQKQKDIKQADFSVEDQDEVKANTDGAGVLKKKETKLNKSNSRKTRLALDERQCTPERDEKGEDKGNSSRVAAIINNNSDLPGKPLSVARSNNGSVYPVGELFLPKVSDENDEKTPQNITGHNTSENVAKSSESSSSGDVPEEVVFESTQGGEWRNEEEGNKSFSPSRLSDVKQTISEVVKRPSRSLGSAQGLDVGNTESVNVLDAKGTQVIIVNMTEKGVGGENEGVLGGSHATFSVSGDEKGDVSGTFDQKLLFADPNEDEENSQMVFENIFHNIDGQVGTADPTHAKGPPTEPGQRQDGRAYV